MLALLCVWGAGVVLITEEEAFWLWGVFQGLVGRLLVMFQQQTVRA